MKMLEELKKKFNIIKKFDAGASSVDKYLILIDSKIYLLRIYDANFMSGRYKAFSNINSLKINNINVPNVVDYGLLDDKKYGYAVVEWIDGVPLDKKLDNEDNILKYSALTAKELVKMHNIRVDNIDIYKKYIDSYNTKVNKLKYLNCAINYKIIDDFVKQYSIFLKNKKTSIIHGDLHPGNIVVSNDEIYFIDLDVCKCNFAWIDLITNACNMDYPDFYNNLIEEYFNYSCPDDFWLIYDLYGIKYCLDNILYCNRINGKNIEDGIDILNKFIESTNNFNDFKPDWFKKKVMRKDN